MKSPPPLPSAQLVPADSIENRPYTARSNADGTFEMHDLGPERYRVKVNALADGIYVKSIHFGNEDVTKGILDLTSGTGGVIDVKLSQNAADVSATVHNAPGEYRICAWEEVDRGLVSDPEFRSHFDSRSVVVKLSEGSHENSDVALLSRDAIEVEAAKVR